MKKKAIRTLKIVAILTIATLIIIAFENWEQEQIDRCVNAGYTRDYCIVKL